MKNLKHFFLLVEISAAETINELAPEPGELRHQIFEDLQDILDTAKDNEPAFYSWLPVETRQTHDI